MNDQPPTLVATAEPADGFAELARLAFGVSRATAASGAGNHGPSRNSQRSLDPLELDLSDPTQREFGDYTLLSRVGQGGMGIVYRAHQRSLDREVAIKLLAAGPWASPGFIERFRQEAQSAARMQHPNIVTIHEIGEHDGLPFFSMRLVRGDSLAQHLHSSKSLTPARAAALMRTVAEAVDYAHRLGVLHLDLKPGNVLLDEHGEALVADFGLARRLEETLAGVGEEVSGTPSYMAPEQVVAGGRLGIATDVYALGATLYEMLTGRPPFRGSSARETLEQVVATNAPVPRTLDKRIPLDLQAICIKCMQKNADARYPSARALAEDLGRYLEGREVQARRLGRGQRAWRLIRREPRLSALMALFVVSLMSGLLATTVQWNRADANAAEARDHLWRARAQAAESALAAGDGFRGLHSMVANLSEMESAGRHLDANLERQRIGTLLANAPQLIDLVRMEQGTSITSIAISPDGAQFAVATHQADGGRHVSLYETASSQRRWIVATDTHTRSTPFQGVPHGYLRFAANGEILLIGLTQQPVFAAPSMSDTLALAVDDGRLLLPPGLGADHADFSFSDDGRFALVRWLSDPSLRFADQVQVYATQDWRPLGPRRAHTATQWMFTPDGSGLLATRDFARFELLDPLTLEARWTLDLPQAAPIHAWRFSMDGELLALGDLRGQVHLVNARDGARRKLATVPAAAVRWLEFNEDASLLAALAEDGSILAWDVASGLARSAPILDRVGNRLGRIRVTGDVILRPAGDELRAWRLPPLAPFDNFAVPMAVRLSNARTYGVHAFDLRAASRLLVVGGSDGLLSLWRMPADTVLAGHAPPLPAGTLHFDGKRVAAVAGTVLQVIDASSGAPLGPELRHPEPVRLAEFSADASRLATIAGRTLRVFDATTLAPVGAPLVLPDTPLRADLARRAAIMVVTTGSYDGARYRERIWSVDLADGRLRNADALMTEPPTEFELDPRGRHVLASSALVEAPAGSMAVIDPARDNDACRPGRADALTNGGPTAMHDDGDSVWLQTLLPDRRARLQRWDLKTCRELLALDHPSVGMSSRLVALGEGVVTQRLLANTVSVVGADGIRRDFEGLAGLDLMYDFAVSHDGKRIAQATRNAVQVTDLERGARSSSLLAAPLPGHDAISKLAFSPDGNRLLGRSARGRWLLWNLPRTSMAVADLGELARVLDPGGRTGAMDDAQFEALRARLRAADPGAPREPADPDRPAAIALPMAPGAQPDPRFLTLDLAAAINVPLNGSWPQRAHTGGDAPTLAPGPQHFNGIDFRIDGGVQLGGGGPAIALHPWLPRSALIDVPGIRAERLHLLMLQRIPTRRGGAARWIAEVFLHGADGRQHLLKVPMLPSSPLTELDQETVRIGWVGVSSSSVRAGESSSSQTQEIVPMISLDVPAEVGVIDAVQLGIGNGQMEAPLFYAVTLETAPVLEAAHAQ